MRKIMLVAGLLAWSSVCGAQNLIQNGGPTYSLAGWDQRPGGCGLPTIAMGASFHFARVDGCEQAFQQAIRTVPGEHYLFEYVYGVAGEETGPGQISVFLGDTVRTVDASYFAYNPYRIGQVRYIASDTLTIVAAQHADGGPMLINRLAVCQTEKGVTCMVPRVVTTPEPSSLALLGTGLIGLVPMVRRSRRGASR